LTNNNALLYYYKHDEPNKRRPHNDLHGLQG
jgi:hypothetical protein